MPLKDHVQFLVDFLPVFWPALAEPQYRSVAGPGHFDQLVNNGLPFLQERTFQVSQGPSQRSLGQFSYGADLPVLGTELAALGQPTADLLLGNAPELDMLAAGDNGGQHALELGGG